MSIQFFWKISCFHKVKQLAVLSLLASFGAAWAQQPVRLNALLLATLNSHPSILQARQQSEAAGFDVQTAMWGRFPSASTEMRSDNRYVQSIARVEQPVWTGGRIQGRIELSEVSLKASRSAVREAQFNALTQLTVSFFEVLRLEARLKGADDNVKEHQTLLQMIQRRVASEVSPVADQTLAQARLHQANSERIQIAKQLDSARNSLVQWSGPYFGLLEEPSRINYSQMKSEEGLIERAKLFSAQRDRLISQIESADKQILLAKAQVYPTVVAGYQHIVSGPLFNAPDRGRAYLGLQYQTGAGLSALSGIQAAVSKKEAAQQELEVFERGLISQAKSLLTEVDSLQAQVTPSGELLGNTNEIVDSYMRQYQVGRKSWLDVLNALREKVAATYNQADVKYGLLLAQIRLLSLTNNFSDLDSLLIYD